MQELISNKTMTRQLVSIRDINKLKIMRLLRLHPGISRSEIVRHTGLGKATISELVTDMLAEALVVEEGVGIQFATAGRRPIKLRLGRTRCAIGIELTGSECIAALTDLYAAPLQVLRMPMPDTSVETSLKVISQAVEDLRQRNGPVQLLGIGVGVPGPVDSEGRRVLQAENIDWYDVPLASLLEERLHLPVILAKRQQAGALGEHWHGVAAGHADLLYISLGVGIGCGIIMRGQLFTGVHGTAGEIGHIAVVSDGERCRCGKYGCLETTAGASAIAQRARSMIKAGRKTSLVDLTQGSIEEVTSGRVIEAAGLGDALAVDIIQEAARHVGAAIATVVNLFNPSMIILDGDIVELGDLFLSPVREVVANLAFSLSLGALQIVPSSLGKNAAAIGAASLIAGRVFAQSAPFSGYAAPTPAEPDLVIGD